MAVDLSRKKSDAISNLVIYARTGITTAAQIAELVAFITDSGFLSGGANPVVDADFVGDNQHMNAADFNAAVTSLATLALSTGNRTTLRKASKSPAV